MNEEAKAKITLGLMAAEEAAKANNLFLKAILALAKSEREGATLDQETTMTMLNEAISRLSDAAERARAFRNQIKDGRTRMSMNTARMAKLRRQVIPMSDEDPTQLLKSIIASMKD